MKRGRVATKRRLVEVANHALSPTQFEAFYAYSPTLPDCALFFGPITGPTEEDSVGDAPLQTDEFEILGGVEAFGFLTPEEAEEAAEDALDRFETVLLECRRLTHPDIPADRPDLFGHVMTTRIANVVGPTLWQTESGTPFASVEFTVSCTSYLIPE